MLFAQLVDDPSDLPEEFPTEAETEERNGTASSRSSRIWCIWENTTNERVLEKARAEIRSELAPYLRRQP